jgi:hypothetical protein
VKGSWLYWLAKGLEGLGLLVVLVGLLISLDFGHAESGLESMVYEAAGLGAGLLLFGIGFLIERRIGTR